MIRRRWLSRAERLAEFSDRITLVEARLRSSCRRCSRDSADPRFRGSCLISVSPRSRSTIPNAGLPTHKMRRWTCGWDAQELTAARGPQYLLRELSWRESCEPTARSGLPTESPARIVAEREREPFGTSGTTGPAALRRRPRSLPQVGRPSCEADLPGAADRGERRARSAGVCAAECHRGARASWPDRRVWPTTRSRTGWSNKSSALPLEDRAPRDLPVVPAELRPELRLLTRGAMRPSAAEIARNPRAASARLRAAERIAEMAVAG